ncbi:MAG: hypothetical protein ACP5NS_03055 [Candidatus Pacearchaeota archaeon]
MLRDKLRTLLLDSPQTFGDSLLRIKNNFKLSCCEASRSDEL